MRKYHRTKPFNDLSDKTLLARAESTADQSITITDVKIKAIIFLCQYCDKKFSSESRLCHHMQVHYDNPSDLLCRSCNKTFKDPKILRMHIKNIHTNPRLKYECCGFAYVSEKKYIAHRDKYHNDQFDRLPTNQFLCKFCNKIFQAYQTIVDHVNNKHTKDSKFLCNICSATYHSLIVLKRHMRKHTEPPKEFNVKVVFECPSCYREFSTSDSLEAHKLTSHTDHYDRLADGKYQCKHCKKVVVAKISMEEHLNAFHFNDRSYLCGSCGKNCYSRISLKKHESIHASTKAFRCEECHKAFKNKEALRKHKKAMHGVMKKFHCSGCTKQFKSHQLLLKHIEMEHSDITVHMDEVGIEQHDPESTVIETLFINEVTESMGDGSDTGEVEEDINETHVFYEAEELTNDKFEKDKESENDMETVTIYEFYD